MMKSSGLDTVKVEAGAPDLLDSVSAGSTVPLQVYVQSSCKRSRGLGFL
jgi:hypothetical protein